MKKYLFLHIVVFTSDQKNIIYFRSSIYGLKIKHIFYNFASPFCLFLKLFFSFILSCELCDEGCTHLKELHRMVSRNGVIVANHLAVVHRGRGSLRSCSGQILSAALLASVIVIVIGKTFEIQEKAFVVHLIQLQGHLDKVLSHGIPPPNLDVIRVHHLPFLELSLIHI